MTDTLPELRELERLLRLDIPGVRRLRLAQVEDSNGLWPIDAIKLGEDRPGLPTFLLLGGVHGVERIGSQVILAYLKALLHRMRWDPLTRAALEHLNLVFIPVLNPVGVWRQHRGNLNGVDLMRNAPIDALDPIRWPFGGQRLSRHLPWYRGRSEVHMEQESQALCNLVRELYSHSEVVIALDLHSGFGFHDRIWFPLAGSTQPVARLAEFYGLKKLLNHSHPHHKYRIEPQSHHYLCHGDLWDYLYLQAEAENRLLLPLTLEMGSWRWVKKNPFHLRRYADLFHPVKPHRVRRVLRHHMFLLEVLWQATAAFQHWRPTGLEREHLHRVALKHWYGND